MIPSFPKAFGVLLLGMGFVMPTLAGDLHVLIIPRIQQAPSIDGRLDDACWAKAAVAKDFLQRRPEVRQWARGAV